MAAVQRWQQWLSNRQQQPADGTPSLPAAAPAAAAAAQPDQAASSCHASALSSSGGTSAPPSAPGSTVGSGEWSKAGGGKAPVGRSSLGLPSSCDGPGSSCCYTVEPGDDEFEDVYGADALTLRSAWRHTETWLAAYILAALLVAVVINIGVGASNSVRRNRVQGAALAYARPPPPPLRAWPPPPSGAPPLPPLPAQPQPLLSPPPAVLLLSPPPPASLQPPPSPAAISEFAAMGAGRSHLALFSCCIHLTLLLPSRSANSRAVPLPKLSPTCSPSAILSLFSTSGQASQLRCSSCGAGKGALQQRRCVLSSGASGVAVGSGQLVCLTLWLWEVPTQPA